MKLFAASQGLSQREDYKWWVLATIAVGIFLNVVDVWSLNIILPTIGTHFDADIPTVQWAVLANALTIAVLLLPMGRLSDVIGRKQVYLVGFGIFIVGAVLSGFSPSLAMLIGSRMLQGAGAAMMQSNFLAIPIAAFPAKERGKAIGLVMSVIGVGGIAGPVLAGSLVGALGWRSIFFFNAAAGVAAMAAGAMVLDKRSLAADQPQGHRPGFDWPGAVLSGGALLLFLLVMTNGHRVGWGSPLIAAGVAAAALLLAGFIWWELRTPAPMLELRLFKRLPLSLAVGAAWLSFLGTSSLLFIMPFYLNKVEGYSLTQVGLIIIPSSACLMLFPPVSGRLTDRFGWRIFTVGGLGVATAAMAVLATTLSVGISLALIIPLLMVRFAGQAVFNPANSAAMFSAVESARHGVVSALSQVLWQSASVTGIALATAIIVATMGSMGYEPSLDAVTRVGGAGVADAFVTGARRAFIVLGALMALGTLLSLFRGEGVKQKQPLAEKQPAEARDAAG